MSSTVQKLAERGLIRPPRFLPGNIHYETMMGSVAYGVSGDSSDVDLIGFCIPPKETLFPHLTGEILGFGTQTERFEQFQQAHIASPDELGGKGRVYDVAIYGIVKYFQLCMENNPNMIDSLFTPAFCVLHITKVGSLVRENRKLFLHKGCWPKFKGYAFSQLHKMSTKEPIGKRAELREKFGFDVKFAYHLVRLLDECEQILLHGDLDLQRNREHLKAIRRGDVSEADVRAWANAKESQLEKLYAESSLPAAPDEKRLKSLLLNCLEEHYGSLSDCVSTPEAAVDALREIQATLDRVRGLIGG
ncbi:MAG TPA: nucleotidyltransferase domain-containing protein [Pirellulales bacterium]